MAMVVKNNMTAINTLNTLNKNSSALSKSLQKVSSGMKINSAADDASGYAISERMRVQIRSLDQANQNTQNGSSMMKVAEGAVSSTVEILKTLKEKAVNAANDSNTDSDRQTIQKELDQSIDQINDNANVTFNGKYLVDGSKNTIGNATYTALSNQSLSEDTTADTKLVNLASRSGDSLELAATDKVTVSYVQGGKTYSTTFQVGDKTLQDIFSAAEDMDETSTIFAASDNEAVKAAGGTEGTSSTSAINKAIEYLKSQLSNGDSTKNKIASVDPATQKGYYHTANGEVAKDAAGNDALTVSTYKDEKGETYAAGSLYNAIVDADAALYDATTAIGSYSSADGTGSGLAKDLGNAMKAAGITNAGGHADWDGTKAGLDAMATRIENAYAADPTAGERLKKAVAAYVEGYNTQQTAKDDLKSAVDNYTEATNQLTALQKKVGVENKKEVLENSTDALVKAYELKINALQAGTDSINYVTELINVKNDGSAGTANTDYKVSGDVDATDENKKKAVEAFRAALEKIALANVTSGKESDAYTNNVQALFKSGGTPLATMTTTDFAGVAADKKNVTDVAQPNTTDLQNAMEKVVSKFTGPAILTGDKVGLGAAGNVIGTASGKNAITITAAKAGIGGQISGFNISVSDAQGNVKKSANAALDAFEETVRAQNKSEDNAISLQIGAKANQSIKVGLTDMRAEALGLQGADGTKLNISTQDKANAAINVLDNAIQKALDQQTTIGSVESRLEYTSSNLTTASENVQASESTIRDADMAKEMTNYTKNNVLLQAAQSMLAQANQSSSNVLSLLQ